MNKVLKIVLFEETLLILIYFVVVKIAKLKPTYASNEFRVKMEAHAMEMLQDMNAVVHFTILGKTVNYVSIKTANEIKKKNKN